ncbi:MULTISPECIES: class I SAM-dependent methyltransferase [unclassified Archaeoglobus]|jgi:SAM-dependent methyltransferase|uniref:class I SAM-dependent methyltransferase n=1 Tax=unclassified Archaeoglobus TaxID=2643606 RepID=UPI0025C455A9|nr:MULTISPECIES: class I SAM-dependent methyltransferase [unclassified Archaeoglobus]
MPHVFDPKKAHILESDWRKKVFPPDEVIRFIENLKGLKKNVAFDIGAGTGYLTIPLAKIFKKVYAVEISFEMAEMLKKRLADEKVLNAGIIVSGKPPEVEFDINLVLFSNVLHEMKNPAEYLAWSRRADFVVVAEWKKEEMQFGPPLEERISIKELEEMCDLRLIKVKDLPYHYLAALKPEKG